MKKKRVKFWGYEEYDEGYEKCEESSLSSYLASQFSYPRQLFSVFNFYFYLFYSPSLIGMYNDYYCILKQKKKKNP